MRALVRTTLVTAVLVAAVGLTGCSAVQGLFGGGETVARDAETQEITEAGSADVFNLVVGDCFDTVDAEEVSEVPAVPCAEPHDDEIYYEFTLPDGEYPGEDAITAAAEAECGPQFDSFVGLAYEESVLDWYPMTPTPSGWDELHDHLVQCVIYEYEVRTVGSLAGVAR